MISRPIRPFILATFLAALGACSSNPQPGDTGGADTGTGVTDTGGGGMDSGTVLPDGFTQYPDGAIVDRDGNVVVFDTGTALPDGFTQFPDGAIVDRDGNIVVIDTGTTLTDASLDGPVIIGNQIYCGGSVCECSDGIDNDGDMGADVSDPECVSPFDDDESSFATGIPGDNMGSNAAIECFFDGNSGTGNDTDCVVPNGCDCRGCCNFDITRNRTHERVAIRDTACHTVTPTTTRNVEGGPCDPGTDGGQGSCQAGLNCLADGDGQTFFCAPCSFCLFANEEVPPVAGCEVNDCTTGEVCIGDPPPDPTMDAGFPDVQPPPDGADVQPMDVQTPPPQCPTGVPPCASHADCAPSGASFFCVTGCCQNLG